MLSVHTELRFLTGVGPRRAASLSAQGLETAEDLLYHLPFRYEDRRAFARIGELLPDGPHRTLSARIVSSRLIRTRRRGFSIFEAVLADESGEIKAVWYNQPYLARIMRAGRHVVLYARAVLDRYKRTVLENPEYEFLDDDDVTGIHTGRIVPVYRKIGDLNSRNLRELIQRVLAELDPDSIKHTVPAEVAGRHGLLDRLDALRAVHFPPPEAAGKALETRRTEAHRTLAFEEIFLLQLALALRREVVRTEKRGITYKIPKFFRSRLAEMLPFKLTRSQATVLREIGEDLKSDHPMHRLLQGDVGSGKTIVALLTMLVAIENGYQAALMAPTEILAEQHARNIRALLAKSSFECKTELLTGSMRVARRRSLLEAIAGGEVQLLIGTHALFEEQVCFRRLGLVVVDEQHRFGVMQRAKLAAKGPRPDVLVMTATPIPRSLALTLYGDLDLSVIDELPPGRTPVRTLVRREDERGRVYEGLRREVAGGRQAYVVVPLVEETAKSDLKAATVFTEQLRREVLPGLQIGMLHGRMKGAEKEAVMQAFIRGETDVLVATTVIEVGVDVSNASAMIIEHAERFGLSQLHQLRGRVGRGAAKSYCVLMVGDGGHGNDARERLSIMEQTTDGFQIAQRDLELRGPGAVFGTQQHGLGDLQFLSTMLEDAELVSRARNEAHKLVQGRPEGRMTMQRLLETLRGGWKKRLELVRVG